jgi:hypothetical protein
MDLQTLFATIGFFFFAGMAAVSLYFWFKRDSQK